MWCSTTIEHFSCLIFVCLPAMCFDWNIKNAHCRLSPIIIINIIVSYRFCLCVCVVLFYLYARRMRARTYFDEHRLITLFKAPSSSYNKYLLLLHCAHFNSDEEIKSCIVRKCTFNVSKKLYKCAQTDQILSMALDRVYLSK